MLDKNDTIKASSLLEIVITMGMLAIFAFVMIPITIQQLRISTVVNSTKDAASQLFLYQQHAHSGKNNKAYGIAYDSNSYTLFIGPSLATAEQSFPINLPNGVYVSNISLSNSASEIVFTPGDFRPSEFGTIRFSDGTNAHVIDINAEGLIYEYAF